MVLKILRFVGAFFLICMSKICKCSFDCVTMAATLLQTRGRTDTLRQQHLSADRAGLLLAHRGFRALQRNFSWIQRLLKSQLQVTL